MAEISIDVDICKKDGLCAMVCMRGLIQQEEKNTIPKIVEPELCYSCGQCVAICPHGAITHSDYPDGSITPIRPYRIPDYDQVMELIHSRRSKRLFKEKPVERADIEKILEAARFAPSGHNEQTTHFTVVQDKNIICDIAVLTANGLRKLVKPLKSPIGRMFVRRAMGARSTAYLTKMAPELEGLADLFESGTDWILHNAPTLVLFHADRVGGTFAGVNANLALHNAALAAETVGLGCFYTGFVVIVSDLDDSIARRVSLPEYHKIYGALALGYPRLKYTNWPQRNPAKVTWM